MVSARRRLLQGGILFSARKILYVRELTLHESITKQDTSHGTLPNHRVAFGEPCPQELPILLFTSSSSPVASLVASSIDSIVDSLTA